MNVQNKFRVRICSDSNYEEMVADVCYDNNTIAMITQENGVNNMKIEIFAANTEIKSWTFPLNDFIENIQFAKNRLIEMQQSS